MFKLIALVLGLVIGFGGGVWWGQKNPQAAATISAQEEKQFLQAQLAMNQKIKAKLDQLSQSSAKTPGSGFLGSGSSSNAAAVNDVKADADKQQADLEARLARLK